MSDLISRQAAIDALYHHFPHLTREECAAILHEVGNVETEIIRCEDCKYGEIDDPDFPDQYFCNATDDWNMEDHFCSYAERREDD